MVRPGVLSVLPLVAARISEWWEPPQGCEKEDWNQETECCCAFCDASDALAFTPLQKTDCFSKGGQCKVPQMSSYQRRPRATAAIAPIPGEGEPEQTHLIGGYPDEVTVVFVTKSPQASEVEFRPVGTNASEVRSGTSDAYSLQMKPDGWQGYEQTYHQPGPEFYICNGSYEASYNATCTYTSDIIHTVKLEALAAGSKYEYRPVGSKRWRSFATPPAVGQPINFGVVADLGQTTDAVATMRHMKDSLDQGRMQTVLFPGDLSYADGFAPYWDNYGRISEFIWETLPAAYVVGNHEYGSGMEQNANFMPRYAWPSKSRSKSMSSHWYSFDAGMAHVVMLCSYCDTSPRSMQNQWLLADMKRVDRQRTPWLIVSFHAPYYSANHGHVGEADVLRDNIEDILYEHKVDIVLTGHVHSYDRTNSMYKNATTCDGPVYITIGDGGNHEGPYCGWRHLEWSAFTENSFGFGEFDIKNATDAEWRFYRNQDSEAVAADSIWLKPAAQRCSQQLVV